MSGVGVDLGVQPIAAECEFSDDFFGIDEAAVPGACLDGEQWDVGEFIGVWIGAG